MNHIKAFLKTDDGYKIPYHSWELRQGGYKWLALVLKDPYLPIERNERLVNFLLENYFKIYAPEIPEISNSDGKPMGVDGFSAHLGSFRAFLEDKENNLPIVPFVFSVASLPFLYYYFHVLPPFKKLILFSPVLDYSKKPVEGSLFCKSRIRLSFSDDMLSEVGSERAEVEKAMDRSPLVSKKLVKDLRREFREFPGELGVDTVDVRVGIFYGESDTLVSVDRVNALKDSLSNGDVDIYTYPRVRHFIFNDKYWKNLLEDLKVFLGKA